MEVIFSEHMKKSNGCFMFEHSTRNKVFEITIRDRLYRISLYRKRSIKSNNVVANDNISEANIWHEKFGHINTERYMKLAEKDSNIKPFSWSVLDSIFY